jgi:lipopolysaccharide transport system ATP-binding protein
MSHAVRAEGLGKRYRIGQSVLERRSMRELLRSPLRNFTALRRLSSFEEGEARDVIWALQDVSFAIKHGEVLGIIGRNGAGKSTLLKILSRITAPSRGFVEIDGRVGALLEVGTGFHHELTGRQNVYLNGSILGMDRRYIDRRFDEIVQFSGVETFIETPVKRYSSGMYLRLAFAVAAHLEPEILIVDEVLAVGDADFQKKCLGKMSDVAEEGRTVLFVSHTLDAVQRLCSRCIHMERGRLVNDGVPNEVITRYLSRGEERPSPQRWLDLSRKTRQGSGEARVVAARFSSGNPQAGNYPYPLGELNVDLKIQSDGARTIASLALIVSTPTGLKLVNADTVMHGEAVSLENGLNSMRISLPELALNPGRYVVGFWLAPTSEGYPILDFLESAFELEVVPDPTATWGKTPGSHGLVASRFSVEPLQHGA